MSGGLETSAPVARWHSIPPHKNYVSYKACESLISCQRLCFSCCYFVIHMKDKILLELRSEDKMVTRQQTIRPGERYLTRIGCADFPSPKRLDRLRAYSAPHASPQIKKKGFWSFAPKSIHYWGWNLWSYAFTLPYIFLVCCTNSKGRQFLWRTSDETLLR